MFDIHTHILPGIDDGSRNTDMSLQMLSEEIAQGVRGIVMTPHFYADSDTPEDFWNRRQGAVNALSQRIVEPGNCPPILLGSEVHFYSGMSRSEYLKYLTIGKTNYILVEMPFRDWKNSYIQEIKDIGNNLQLQVILAHIDRYLDRDKDMVEELIYDCGCLLQVNAEGFTDRRTKRKVMKLYKEGLIDFLGSDCHNMAERHPNLGQIEKILLKDKEAMGKIEKRSIDLFREAGAKGI